MSSPPTKDIRVLAVDPSPRGFGYAVLEGPDRLIDWGVKETKTDKNKRSLKLIADLIEQYEPSVLVLEDYAGKGSRRCRRVVELIGEISSLALQRKVRVKRFSRAEIKQTFAESGATTKYEIAIIIAKRFPELTPRLPRFRKPWMSEDYRMSIFDAVGLALAFISEKQKGRHEGYIDIRLRILESGQISDPLPKPSHSC
jgi:Holliday junction resolvasome RuvABC endonuclease subunit